MFEKNTNNVSVISIIGLKNSGKSFIINHIIGVEKAFHVNKDKINKVVEKNRTVISFFSEPIRIEKDNQVFDIFIMDSHGFFPDLESEPDKS